jgi:hypothetical protein
MDDDSFMEPAGFWTRGESPTAVVIDAPDRNELGLRVRNGAVANRVELSAAEWHSSLSLAPGEVRDVDLPAAAARLLRIQTAAGFRPADVDPASGDRRTLGVWVEFREP